MQIDKHSCYYYHEDYRIPVPQHLAKVIGLNATMVLSQIMYWVNNPRSGYYAYKFRHTPDNDIERIPIAIHTKDNQVVSGKKWVRDSAKELKNELAVLSLSEIRKNLSFLVKHNIVYCANINKYLGYSVNDRTNWYAVNFYKLNKMFLESSFVPAKNKMRVFNGDASVSNFNYHSNYHDMAQDNKGDYHSNYHLMTHHLSSRTGAFVMRCHNGTSRDDKYTNNNNSSNNSSNNSLLASYEDRENRKNFANDKSRNMTKDKRRDNSLKPNTHISKSTHIAKPTGQLSEKEPIPPKKKDVTADFNNIRNMSNMVHYSAAKKLAETLNSRVGCNIPQWIPIFNSLLASVKPRDIDKAIESGIRNSRPVRNAVNYICGTSKKIAESRRAKDNKRHSIDYLTKQLMSTKAGKAHCSYQSAHKWFMMGINSGMSPRQYKPAIKALSVQQGNVDPARFMIQFMKSHE